MMEKNRFDRFAGTAPAAFFQKEFRAANGPVRLQTARMQIKGSERAVLNFAERITPVLQNRIEIKAKTEGKPAAGRKRENEGDLKWRRE